MRRVILRGLKADPAQRWPSMAALIAALDDDPAAKLRRRCSPAGDRGRRGDGARRRLADGRRASAPRPSARSPAYLSERARAAQRRRERRPSKCASCGSGRSRRSTRSIEDRGETLWRETRALLPDDRRRLRPGRAGASRRPGSRPARGEISAQLADVLYEHLLFAEDFRLETKARVLRRAPADGETRTAAAEGAAATGTLTLRTTAADDARRARALRA